MHLSWLKNEVVDGQMQSLVNGNGAMQNVVNVDGLMQKWVVSVEWRPKSAQELTGRGYQMVQYSK